MINLIKHKGFFTTAGSFFILFSLALLFTPTVSTAQNPQTPDLDSVSIVGGGNPIISWFPNSTNTTGYVIVRGEYNAGILIWQRIDTVFGITQSSYIDNAVSACDESKWYRIYAFAGSLIPDSPWSDTLKTIFLEDPILNICANTISLAWTNYVNMVTQLDGYQILVSENGGTYNILETVAASQTSYLHAGLSPGILYTYKIRAVNEDGSRTSASCEKSILSKTYNKPTYAHIRYATVENNEHVKLEWITDDAPITKFNVLRSEDDLNYGLIKEIQDISTYSPTTVYIDTSADFNAMSYYYKISVCDSCGFDIFESENTARTIHLSGQPEFVGFLNALEWNAYEGWSLGINNYVVFRKINENPAQGLLPALPSTETNFRDDVTNLGNFEGSFTYYVEGLENDGDNGFESVPDKSVSNEVKISQETRILIPNAFIPGGTPPDDEFKPIISFIELDNYTLLIFNKWGQQLFSTNEISTGWDGRFNGELVPADTYVYVIKYVNAKGENAEKHGTVAVVR